MTLNWLRKAYFERKAGIKKRLAEFREVWKLPDDKIFFELCFCIMTANGSAKAAWTAQQRLMRRDPAKMTLEQVRSDLSGVRFANNKSRYITSVRNCLLESGKIRLKERLAGSEHEVRNALAKDCKNFPGLGMKEASHFMRNIGRGEKLAILDRHILKNLVKLGVIKEVPVLTPKRYLDIERKMADHCRRIGIPLAEMDLLLWSQETGHIFK